MRKKAGTITLFTSVAASIGMFTRWVQNNSLYEPGTGLATPGLTSSKALITICAAALLGLLALTLSLGHVRQETDYRISLRARTILYPFAALILGLLMAAGALMLLRDRTSFSSPLLPVVLAIAALPCAASFPLLAIGPKKDSNGWLTCVASLCPVVFLCIWLVANYRENSATPVLWSFVMGTLAIAAAITGFYYLAGYAFNKARPKATVYFAQAGAFFCIVTLSDNHKRGITLFFLACALMLLAQSYVLMDNFREAEVE